MRQVVLAVCLAVAAAQTSTSLPDLTLPPVALQAADAGPLETAFVLARLSVPVGVVTTANPSAPDFKTLELRLGFERRVRFDHLLDRLRTAHDGLLAEWRNEVLHLTEANLACGRAVMQTMLEPFEVEGHMPQLLTLLGWLAGGESGPVPASMVSPASGDPEAVLRPLPVLQVKTEDAATLADALDEVVRQSGGGAWIVWQHERDDSRIGCRLAGYFPNGHVGASSADFAIDPG